MEAYFNELMARADRILETKEEDLTAFDREQIITNGICGQRRVNLPLPFLWNRKSRSQKNSHFVYTEYVVYLLEPCYTKLR